MAERNQENDIIGNLVCMFEEPPYHAPRGISHYPIHMLMELEKV
jgi:hypothetical protein